MTRSWVDDTEAMYEEEGVAALAENVPKWAGTPLVMVAL